MNGPGFWKQEQSGVLAPVVAKYLNRETMNVLDVAVMKSYLTQWVKSPVWDGNPYGISKELTALRRQVERITSAADIDEWISAALEIGIDPL